MTLDEPAIDKCINGHPWTPETTRWESSGSGGRLRKRCRQCRRDKKAAAKAGAVEGQLPTLGAERSRRARPEPMPTEGVKAVADFEEALDNVTMPCKDRSTEFTDWDEDAIPSPRTAETLCGDCPALLLCRGAARYKQPGWGVWGGEVWVYEKIYKGGTA